MMILMRHILCCWISLKQTTTTGYQPKPKAYLESPTSAELKLICVMLLMKTTHVLPQRSTSLWISVIMMVGKLQIRGIVFLLILCPYQTWETLQLTFSTSLKTLWIDHPRSRGREKENISGNPKIGEATSYPEGITKGGRDNAFRNIVCSECLDIAVNRLRMFVTSRSLRYGFAPMDRYFDDMQLLCSKEISTVELLLKIGSWSANFTSADST